jgi:hypothetical protein
MYPSNLIVSTAYSKYVFYIYHGVQDMEKFDVMAVKGLTVILKYSRDELLEVGV